MSVSLEDAKRNRHAQQLADRLGVSVPEAIDIAVREKLTRLPEDAADSTAEDRAAALLRLGAAIGDRIGNSNGIPDDGDLYDEQGLPT